MGKELHAKKCKYVRVCVSSLLPKTGEVKSRLVLLCDENENFGKFRFNIIHKIRVGFNCL